MKERGMMIDFDPALRRAVESLLLPGIQLPGQYIGGELGIVAKGAQPGRFRVCLAFPDAYSIGMSNYATALLYSILNARDDMACERAFTPFPDMEQALRAADLPLYSLETFAPLWSFDLIGISLQQELCGTNLLTMLDLGRIPIRAAARDASSPLVVAGGPGVFNPEPFAPFFDAFVLGDGEETLPALCDFWSQQKKRFGIAPILSSERGGRVDLGPVPSGPVPSEEESRTIRRGMLLAAAKEFDWLYVPAFYSVSVGPNGRAGRPRPTEPGVPEFLIPAAVKKLDDFPPPTFPVTPLVEAVQDRVGVEIMRGCPQKCRFCQSSPIKRPLRFRSPEQIVTSALTACRNTGIREVTLLSLSSSEYPNFESLLGLFAQKTPQSPHEEVTVAVPSLRVDHQLSDVVSHLSTERSGSLTLAPEAARDRLRQRLAKRVTDDDLLRGCAAAFEHGFYRIKMYFMVGFPGEIDDDIDGILELATKIAQLGKQIRGRWPVIVANVSNFVPKPQTPLQWAAMATEETFRRIHRRLREAKRDRSVELKYHDLSTSLLEGLLSRGDRRVAEIIEKVWRRGGRFCAWKEHYAASLWQEEIAASNIDTTALLHTEYALDDELPWDHITVWAGREKLRREYEAFVQG